MYMYAWSAVHLACIEETIAEYLDETIAALRGKHHRPFTDSDMTPLAGQH